MIKSVGRINVSKEYGILALCVLFLAAQLTYLFVIDPLPMVNDSVVYKSNAFALFYSRKAGDVQYPFLYPLFYLLLFILEKIVKYGCVLLMLL